MSSQTYEKNIKEVDEFYVFLTSEPDPENGYKNNSPGSFTNRLKTPLNFKDQQENWQVALENIEIPNAIYNITGSLCEFTYRNIRLAPYKEDQTKTLLQSKSFEPLIDRNLTIPPGYYDPWTYCSAVNSAFTQLKNQEKEIRLKEAYSILSKEKVYWDHHSRILDERPLTNTESTSDDIKKSKLEGTITDEEVDININDKKSIPFPEADSGEFLSFWSTALAKYKTQQMLIEHGLSPVSSSGNRKRRRVEDLLSLEVPEILIDSDFKLKFEYILSPFKKFHITLNKDKEKIFFKEDEKLHEVLGFENKILEEGLNVSNIVTTMNKHNGLLFVYCNLVDYSAVASQSVPLLKLFNITDLLRATSVKIDTIEGHEVQGWGPNQHHVNHLDYINLTINRLHYYPIHSTLIKDISIDLRNSDGYVFKFEKTFLNTVITLHFRRKPKYKLVEYNRNI